MDDVPTSDRPRKDGTAGTAGRWDVIVDSVIDLVSQLARRFVGRVHAIPGYEDDTYVTDDELYETAVGSIGRLAECMRDAVVTPELVAIAENLGAKRARQGVPAEALATAVQLNFGVIWGELLEICGPRDAVVLTAHVEPVWRMVDAFAARAQTAYHAERGRLAQEEVNFRQAIVSRLFASKAPSATTVARVARDLRIDADADYMLVAADHSEAQERLHDLAMDQLHPRYFVYRTAGLTIAFWPADAYAWELGKLVDQLACVRLRRVPGLDRIVSAAKAAMNLLEVLEPTNSGPVDLDDGIPLLARHALETHEVDLATQLEEALLPCTEAERERIKETVVAFLECGSAQTTATQLYCHRNTVLNRLSRFAELTGLDVNVPRQAATAVLAWSPSRPNLPPP